ncbi:MAG: SRPBCC family protein [Candidatus Promineifilaceae bacterium]|nr:SRPBCC family protein [Candidatus Promineifilaceae bacterium]
MADMKVQRSVVVEAPPEKVYDYISDFQRHTEWNYQPQKIEKVSDGPVGVGSTFHTTEALPRELPWLMKKLSPLFFKLMGSADHTVAEITAMEPARRLAWKSWQPIRGGKRAVEVEWEILLEPENGGTRLIQRSHWVGKHSMSDPSMFADEADHELEDNLGRLKQILESEDNHRGEGK